MLLKEASMAQSNLAKKFVKARNILEEGDFKEIHKNLWLFQDIYMTVNRYMEKFIKTDVNTLDVCAGDIKDLCDLMQPLLQKYEGEVTHQKMYKAMYAGEEVNDQTFNAWARRYTDLFDVVAKLRNCLSIYSYTYCVLDVYEQQWDQNNNINTIFTTAIKDYMRYNY